MPIWRYHPRPTGQIQIEYADIRDACRDGYGQRIVTIDLLTCCHCGRDFKLSRGSAARRGFCLRHGAVTCGDDACQVCPSLSQRGVST